LNPQTIVNGGFTDAIGAGAHVGDGSEAFASQKISTGGSKNNGERNQPAKSDANIIEKSIFGMKRSDDHQAIRFLRRGKSAGVAASSAMSRWNISE
jgi:hypothetical protein